jgi:MFS family permease
MNNPVLAEEGAKLGAPGMKATRVRARIMALIVVSAVLTYLDRLNFSFAGKSIQEEFQLDAQTMGWVLSAFLLGYALTQLPGGWLSDKFGPRRLLVFVIIWWSIFTAATAWAPNLPTARWFGVAWSFAIVRFLIGRELLDGFIPSRVR